MLKWPVEVARNVAAAAGNNPGQRVIRVFVSSGRIVWTGAAAVGPCRVREEQACLGRRRTPLPARGSVDDGRRYLALT